MTILDSCRSLDKHTIFIDRHFNTHFDDKIIFEVISLLEMPLWIYFSIYE